MNFHRRIFYEAARYAYLFIRSRCLTTPELEQQYESCSAIAFLTIKPRNYSEGS